MKTIVIKTQAEIDALPKSFEEFTVVEIRSDCDKISVVARDNSRVEACDNSSVVAWGNSRVEACNNSSVEACDNSSVVAWGNSRVVARDSSSVVAWGNSRVEAWWNSRVVARDSSSVEAWGNSRVVAWGNSRVEACNNSSVEACDNSSVVAWGNSRVVARDSSSVVARDSSSVEACDNSSVEAFESSMLMVFSSYVLIKKLLDYSTAVFKGCSINIDEKSDTSFSVEIPSQIKISFDEWLRRGYVSADGILKKLLSQKKIGEIEVFEVEEFIKRKSSYVVKRGQTFSHGETIEKAIEDLRYKISDRDVSKYIYLKSNLHKPISLDEAIQAYRTITGACEFGVKEFIKILDIPEEITPHKVLELTKNQFGHAEFKAFLKG